MQNLQNGLGLSVSGFCGMVMKMLVSALHVQVMQGQQGVVAHVKLPKDKELRGYDRLELDFALGCPGAQPHSFF